MFATATTCKISAVPTARAQRRARRSVAVRAEGAEETAAPVAVRCANALADRRGRIDARDEDAWGTRARGDEMDGEEFVSSNATGGSARARSAARDARDDGDGAMGAIAGDRYASVSWRWIDLGG